jgi:hypothetical protein
VLQRLRAEHEKWAIQTRDVGLIPEPDLEERARTVGTRYQVLRQPESEKFVAELRALVDAVNRDEHPDLVQRAINHPDAAMRYWAVVGLTKTASAATAARDSIAKAAADPSPSVRIAALRATALYLDDETAIPKLAAEMKSPNPYVRLHAAQALDALGPRAAPARKALTEALSDDIEYVKRIAEHAVAALAGG